MNSQSIKGIPAQMRLAVNTEFRYQGCGKSFRFGVESKYFGSGESINRKVEFSY